MADRKGTDLGLSAIDVTAEHYKSAWSSATAYAANDVVTRAYALYIATQGNTNSDPVLQALGAGFSTSGPGTGITSISDNYQPFTPSSNITVSSITLITLATTNVGHFKVGIASAPGANAGASTYLTQSGVVSNPGDGVSTTVTASFTPVALTAGTTYYLVLAGSAGDAFGSTYVRTATDPVALSGISGVGALFPAFQGAAWQPGDAAHSLLFSATGTIPIWEKMANLGIDPATAPTLTSLGGCKSTVGAGLPPFIGRNQGDFAYDTTTGKEHVLTGAAGALVTDNFNRTDSTGLGTSSSGTAWAARGGSAANVAGNVAVGTSGGQNYVPVTAGDQTVSLSFISPGSGTADVSLVGRLDSATGTDYEGRFFHTSGAFISLGISRGGTGALVALAATTLSYVAGHTYAVTLSVTGQDVTLTATDLGTGASVSITTTDGGTVLTGPNAGFSLNAGNGSVDNFTAFNNGTLKWTYNEPLYLSCVVPGAVTVGTHIFKPGLRIPTGPTTARRLTIRTDTAATAGGITVVGHRYNNGVDTGDTITASIASGANVGSTTAAVDTASGDMWKFDVTVANGGSDLLISLDCY